MFRNSLRLTAFAGLALLVPFLAFGRAAERVLPGQKVFGELDRDDSVTVLVDGVAGTQFSAACKAFRGTGLQVDIALAEPDGKPVDLTGLKKTNAAKSTVSFAGVLLAKTGSYRVQVSSLGVTFGGFDLVTKGAAPKKSAGTAEVTGAGPAVISFGAAAGDAVTCSVKKAKGSALVPLIHRFVDAGGGETLIDAAKQTAPVTVTTTGTSRFEIAGDAASAGTFTWSLKFTRAKAPKEARDAEALEAAGDISGVIVLDGISTRTSVSRAAKAPAPRRAPDVRPGEIIVAMPDAKSHAEVAAAAMASMPGTLCTVAAALSETGPYLVRIEHLAVKPRGDRRAKTATRALAKTAAASRSLTWAEPNALAHATQDPNDTRYNEQFNLRQLGLPLVWDQTEGDASVVIAIVDSGYVYHPDLSQNLTSGYDFVSDTTSADDGDGWDASPLDASYVLHGTHVAGIVGARTNNKSGIAGVVWTTKMVPVRVLGHDGWGTFFDIAAGVRWAAGLAVSGAPANQNPARVINLSLGAAYDAQVMRDAIDAVHGSTDAVIVAAAGNESSSEQFFPAAYPDVICVYALDANYYWATYSNYGDWIFVGAPGGDTYRGQAAILSTYFDMTTGAPSYQELQGTSMASPQVAGIVALLIAKQPNLSRTEIRTAFEKTSLDLGPPGFDPDFGWGMVDARAALEYVLTPFAPPNAIDVAPTSLSFEGVSNLSIVAVRTKAATPVTIGSVVPTTEQGGPWLNVAIDQMVTPATLTVSIDPLLDAGVYDGKVRLTTSAGVVDVDVHVVRAPRPKVSFVVVSALDGVGRVVAQTATNEAKGWAYTLPDLPLGSYRITALADLNANLVLDRIDEWDGIWPLRTQPELVSVSPDDLDRSKVDMALDRYDSRMTYTGVGTGHISGALAVRAFNAHNGRGVAAANVHIGTGSALAVTDARGRAVVAAAFDGAQTVTIVAGGYGPMTRVGADAQFQTFPLEPVTPRPTLTTTVTVNGLGAADRTVLVAVGDAMKSVAYAGSGTSVIPISCTDTGEPIPVAAAAFEQDGSVSRHALFEAQTVGSALDVAMTVLPIGGAQARFAQPSLGPGTFTTSGATVRATTYLRWNGAQWLALGDSPMTLGQEKQGWWPDPASATLLPMKFEVSATDTAGRSLRRIHYGTTADLQPFPTAFTFDPAPGLSTPAANAQNVSLTPTFAFTALTTAHLHKLVVENPATGWRWTVWLPGYTTSFQLPLLPQGGLAAATTYRWSVEAYRFAAGFNVSNFREEVLEKDATSRTFSGWQTFRTL